MVEAMILFAVFVVCISGLLYQLRKNLRRDIDSLSDDEPFEDETEERLEPKDMN